MRPRACFVRFGALLVLAVGRGMTSGARAVVYWTNSRGVSRGSGSIRSALRVAVAVRVGLALAGAFAVASASAHADINAVVEHVAPGRQDLDVIRVDASTGGITPAPFNTTANELLPSVSADGSRIAFERFNPFSGGSPQLFLNDLHTGKTVMFSSEAGGESPAISSDGQTFIGGGGFQKGTPVGVLQPFLADLILTSLATFPTGPFTHSEYQGASFFAPAGGIVVHPVESGSLVAYQARPLESPIEFAGNPVIVVGQLGGASSDFTSGTAEYGEPAIGTPGGVPTVLFDEDHPFGPPTRIFSLPVSNLGATPTALPAAAGASGGFDPAFSPDGRYIGFLRTDGSGARTPDPGDTRLFVWDTETQTLINPAGVDIGKDENDELGFVDENPERLSLYKLPVIVNSQITPVGAVKFTLAAATAAGILVQRVVGHHELFGRRVPTLVPVGHVPLGKFKKGNQHVRWNLRVNGRPLPRGTYQVTLRSLTPSKQIRDLGVPRLIHVP